MVSLFGFSGVLTPQVEGIKAVTGEGDKVLPVMIRQGTSLTANAPYLFNRQPSVDMVWIWVVVEQRNPLNVR